MATSKAIIAAIQQVAESNGVKLTQKVAKDIQGAFIDTLKQQLQTAGKADLYSFGVFSLARRAAATARNPQTGAKIDVPAKNRVKFSAGKSLKDEAQAWTVPEKKAK